jgi:hypothetical protein
MGDKAPLTVDNALQVAFNLEGRDKINKVVQYGSRAVAFYLLAGDPKSSLGQRFAELYKVSQQGRKFFRIGKSMPLAKKGLQIMDDKSVSPGTKYLQLINTWGLVRLWGFSVRSPCAHRNLTRMMPCAGWLLCVRQHGLLQQGQVHPL